MHRNQFESLKKELDLNDYGDASLVTPIMLYITSGRHKGQVGRVTRIEVSNITVQVGEHKPVKFPYSKLEQADAEGKPIVLDALDITGRPITGNNVVAYSVSTGENSHALEIGRVLKTNPTGSLTVQPIIQNGERVGKYWSKARSSISPNRVIILPVDATLVTAWVLSNFELFKTDLVD